MADILVTVPDNYSPGSAGKQITLDKAMSSVMRYTLDARNNTASILTVLNHPDQLAAALLAHLPADVEITEAALQAALVGALRELATAAPAE